MSENITLTADSLDAAALGIADVIAKLSHGLEAEAVETAESILTFFTALLPPRRVSDLKPELYSQLVGMHCIVSSKPWMGIITDIGHALGIPRVQYLELSPRPRIASALTSEVMVSFVPAFPASGLPSGQDKSAEADEEEVLEEQALATELQTSTSEPGKASAEDLGYPISFEEFQTLPNKSAVAAYAAGGEPVMARRTRKNRWFMDGSGGTSNDADTWEGLLDHGDIVYCVHRNA
ncbi:hypothetical protein [Corynebacterium flavescens]|uniref:hypothetical protein n=1 Tax=Corynebacterium flavescens TaxID=28028 RepID=UPI0028A2DDE1|nr:hypothetical protein [Corynebacterium flavescens]